MLLSPATISFILQHRNDDVYTLALRPVGEPDVDLKAALEQISGWQKASLKLPMWAEKEGIVYPPALSMEQCSSQRTALYKAELARRIAKAYGDEGGGKLVDLTGGFGVDFSFMAPVFKKAVYVERQQALCRIAKHNFDVLGLHNATVMNASAEDFAAALDSASLIFLDPARRDTNGKRTYAIEDCTPNALTMMPLLLAKTPAVMVKLSPMLDWRKAVSDFKGAVSEVHIIAVGGECKELLLILDRQIKAQVEVSCVNDGDILQYSTADIAPIKQSADAPAVGFSFISEPNAAVMKAGCFSLIEQRFGVKRIGINSNLFVSDEPPKGFPGRVFAVNGVSTMNRREVKALLSGVSQANIAVRNFPLSVAELRKRLKIKDGGECYIFATTDRKGRHILIKGARVK